MKKWYSFGLIISLFVTVWQSFFYLGYINKAFLPSPLNILEVFFNKSFWLLFAIDLFTTFSNICIGVVIGYFIVYTLLIISFYSSFFAYFIRFINTILKYIPLPALIPIGILFFGLSSAVNIFLVALATFTILLQHNFSLIEKEEKAYEFVRISWVITPWQRFWKFLFPMSNYLGYRVIPTLIIWVLSIEVIVEMILGGKSGIGVRLLQFQQLYKTGELYSYLLLIIGITFLFELVIIQAFSRFIWDIKKATIWIILITLIFVSAGSYLSSFSFFSKKRVIVTYSATANLPLMVYIKKFNSLNFSLVQTGSGLQAMDTLQAGKADIAGFIDMPNALTGIEKNSKLRMVAQLVESPSSPSLFLIGKKVNSLDNLKGLENSIVGYYPNNSLIKSGLDFSLFKSGVNTSNITYTSSNDPLSLVQSIKTGFIESFLGPEPFVSDIENELGISRVNKDKSLVQGVGFKNLPLASLVIDTSKFSESEKKDLLNGINQSIDYIRNSTGSDGRANSELSSILKDYEINQKSVISKYQNYSEIDADETKKLIDLINLYDPNSALKSSTFDVSKYYIYL